MMTLSILLLMQALRAFRRTHMGGVRTAFGRRPVGRPKGGPEGAFGSASGEMGGSRVRWRWPAVQKLTISKLFPVSALSGSARLASNLQRAWARI